MRLRPALALLAVVLLVSACSVTKGSGQVVTETREVSGFTQGRAQRNAQSSLSRKRGPNRSASRREDNLLPLADERCLRTTPLILGTKPNTEIVPTQADHLLG